MAELVCRTFKSIKEQEFLSVPCKHSKGCPRLSGGGCEIACNEYDPNYDENTVLTNNK